MFVNEMLLPIQHAVCAGIYCHRPVGRRVPQMNTDRDFYSCWQCHLWAKYTVPRARHL